MRKVTVQVISLEMLSETVLKSFKSVACFCSALGSANGVTLAKTASAIRLSSATISAGKKLSLRDAHGEEQQ